MTTSDDRSGRAAPAGPAADSLRPPEPPPAPRAQSLHLFDHDSETLLFLFEFLSDAGFNVSTSSNVVDAFDYVEREQPDLVIADMEMPGLSGVELLARLRDLAPRARVIMTSRRVDWSAYEDLVRSGGAFVMKPIKGISLLRAVERVLDA